MHSEIVLDRRTRKRDQRREALLDLAADLIDRDGVDGFTMTALAEAADYAPASLYTYVPSRSALFTQLQLRALATLTEVARRHREMWLEAVPGAEDGDDRVVDLGLLLAYGDLFLTAPTHHPREFKLQQQLLTASGVVDRHDAAQVVPPAMQTLDVPRSLFERAMSSGALSGTQDDDPITATFGTAMMRTFSFVIAVNGALMVDSLIEGRPGTGLEIGRTLARTLLGGWGASPERLAGAGAVADRLAQLEGSDVGGALATSGAHSEPDGGT